MYWGSQHACRQGSQDWCKVSHGEEGHLFHKLSEQGIPDVPGAVIILKAPVLRVRRFCPQRLLKVCTCMRSTSAPFLTLHSER